MKVYELTVTLLLKESIYFQKINESLSAFLNRSMLHDLELKKLHSGLGYKFYTFSGLFPVESKTKIYEEGKVYVFRIRSLKKIFIEKIRKCIRQQEDPVFHTLSTEKRVYGNRIIQELYTVTPFIVTIDGGPWLQQSGDLDLLMKRLNDNTEKKFNTAFEENLINSNFIQRIEFTNEKPASIYYKKIKLLGNKARLTVNNDETSQKLAYTVLGAGLAEKQSIGAGFCFANFI